MPPCEAKHGLGAWSVGAEGLLAPHRARKAGIVAAVTTRTLGDMKRASRRREAAARAGLAGRPVFVLDQVHGSTIALDRDAAEGACEADGWVVGGRSGAFGVFIADCLPLFLWPRSGAAAGVFHVGWRGAEAGMPEKAVAAMRERLGAKPEELCAAIGPHIGACCYVVGEDVASRFHPGSAIRREGKTYFDLSRDVARRLRESGVGEANIEEGGGCTFCREDLYYSRRREPAGHMLAFVGIA